MIIISISKRKLKLAAALVLAVLLTFVGINQIFGNARTEKFKELVQVLRQPVAEVSEEVLTSTSPTPDNSKEVQIFNVEKSKVVKRMTTTPEITAEAEKILNSVTGLYVKVQPLPSKGFIVKVPINPALKVQNKYINALVDKVYIIFTEKEPPILLILDEKEKPYVYNFSASTEVLKKSLNFKFTYE